MLQTLSQQQQQQQQQQRLALLSVCFPGISRDISR